MLTTGDIARLFRQLAETIGAARDELCRLDGVIGDADHGIAMAQGFAAASGAIDALPAEATLADQLNAAAKGFLNAVGASSGPLYATALMRAAKAAGARAEMSLTEAPMLISMMAPEDHRHPDGSIATGRLSSAGRVGPLVRVGIMDGDGHLMPVGERGEIVVRGSLVMDGYYKNAEATAEASAHGWHHTGDIGYLDADNFLYIVDRAKDMIITGGFNVYSVEVENALQAHDTIQDCAVIGLPDEKWGERVVAVVQPRAGRTVDVAEVSSFVKQRVGSVKTPKHIEVWDDLPRSKVGKVLKAEIRARMLANAKP